jgi:hypothetical protein
LHPLPQEVPDERTEVVGGAVVGVVGTRHHRQLAQRASRVAANAHATGTIGSRLPTSLAASGMR